MKTGVRFRFRLTSLSAVAVCGFCLSVDVGHGALKREPDRLVPPRSTELPSPNKLAISRYEMSDPTAGDSVDFTNQLMTALKNTTLASHAEVFSKDSISTQEECQKDKKNTYDVVRLKETDYGKDRMVLELSVQSGPEIHQHGNISIRKIGDACTYYPNWDDCRKDKIGAIVEQLRGLDSFHKHAR